MTLYVDASAIVATIARQANGGPVDSWVRKPREPLAVSDFALAETSAALAALGRRENWSASEVAELFGELDEWAVLLTEPVEIDYSDVAKANIIVRRPGIALRAPDAIHIAAAHRLGATLLTLDRGMARAAAALGVNHLNPAEAEWPGEPKD